MTAPNVEFDLHGLVGLRVLDPTPRDVATIVRQLGPLQAPLGREPDITVRFVDRIPDERGLTYASWGETGFTEDTFFLLRGRTGVEARAVLPIADIGGRCDIVCERRIGTVPHLLAVVNLTALAKGILPLHASAFVHRGVGVLATGWAKGGKTETLLAFAGRGAAYVGDEWIYLTPDGTMHGVPEPIRLWYWHVAQLDGLRSGLSLTAKVRLTGLPAMASTARALAARLPAASGAASILRRAAPVIRRQAYLHATPAELFGADALPLTARLDTLLLLAGHDQPTVTVEPADAVHVGRRMRASLEDERAAFMAFYRQFRFAFPDRRSEVVERAGEIEGDLLDALLAGRTAHVIRHPYPVDLGSLVDPIESVLPHPPTVDSPRSNARAASSTTVPGTSS